MANSEKIIKKFNLDLKNLAPICISVYTRIEHFKNCIESLVVNDLAKHSVLYIFSDAAKPGDEEAVSKVREYASSISGFKDIKLIFQKKNNFKKNMQDLYLLPFATNSKSIIMEDDVVVQKSFLKFMNIALNIYEKSDDIFCICGRLGPENHLKKSNDAQAFQIPNMSGIGYWKKEYCEFLNDHRSSHPWLRFKKNIFYSIKFMLFFGISYILQYKKMYEKNLFYEDVLTMEYIFRKRKLAVIPPFTLALNKGYDGSGIYCGINEEFQNEKFLRQSDNFGFPIKFNQKQARHKTQKQFKSTTGLKPNYVRQVYAFVSHFYQVPKIIRDFFKKMSF